MNSAHRIVLPLIVGGLAFAAGWAGHGLRCHRAHPAPAPIQADADPAPASALPAPTTAPFDLHPSLVYWPFNNLTNESPEGVAAARLLLSYLDTGDPAPVRQALAAYQDLGTRENFGGEYPTLQWFCEYALADDAARMDLMGDDDGRRFVEFFGRDGWRPFREYLLGKYGLERSEPDRLRFVDEIVRFNSPSREAWEKTDRVLELLALQPGMQVADIGAGAGYFSFRLAQAVGPEGRVHAVEMNRHHIEYLAFVAASEGLSNLQVTPTDGSFPTLPDASLDRILLCSTYQTLYLSFRQAERDAWVAALRRALKPGGLLLISENEPVVGPDVVPYRGLSVSRPLIEGQLLSYGFELVASDQAVPQRYLLLLRNPAGAP